MDPSSHHLEIRESDKDMISLDMTNNTIISSTFDQENGEMASRTTSIQEGEDDEDIPAIDTTTTPTPKKDQKVLSFMRVVPNIHENVMLPKSELFGSLRNDGQCMDERDNFRSMFTHGDGRMNMIRCCSRSSPTSLWIQEKLESQFFMLWTQIWTAEIDLNSICYNFRIRTPNGVNIFLVESLSRSLSNKISLTSKFVSSRKWWPKESDPVAETGPEDQEKGAVPPLIGPIGLVRVRVEFLVPWGVFPPPWPPPLPPIDRKSVV